MNKQEKGQVDNEDDEDEEETNGDVLTGTVDEPKTAI